jgi:elongation factor Tu
MVNRALLPHFALLGAHGGGKRSLLSAIWQEYGFDRERIGAELPASVLAKSYIPPCFEVASEPVRFFAHNWYYGMACHWQRSMLRDHSIISGLIVVIAADGGFEGKTRDQVIAARHFGIERLIVLINKCDRADGKGARLAEADAITALDELGFGQDAIAIVRGSANSAAIDAELVRKQTVDAVLEAAGRLFLTRVPEVEAPLLPPIESFFRISGRGTIAVGLINRGRLMQGDYVELIGPGGIRRVRVEAIEQFRRTLSVASAGQAVGVELDGVDDIDNMQVHVLSAPAWLRARHRIDAHCYLLPGQASAKQKPLPNGAQVDLFIWASRIRARVLLEAGEVVALPGSRFAMTLEVDEPVPVEAGQRFMVMYGGFTQVIGTVAPSGEIEAA